MNNIHIVLASDNNYVQHLGVALISILENKASDKDIFFHVLENGLSEINKEKIISISHKYRCELKFYNISENRTKDFPELGHLSRATYLRLFISDILPIEIEKVIYLDCDLVVLKDLGALYEMGLKGNALAAVKDVKAAEIIRIFFYPNLQSYFNAGVILIDVKMWRYLNIVKRAESFIGEYRDKLITADQDVLNCLFKNIWLELPSIFNMDMKHKGVNSLPSSDTVVLHYSDRIKPWSYLYCGRNKKYYFQYLAKSPWADFLYRDKTLKNFFRKYILAINHEVRNWLRSFMPGWLIDWNKKMFLKKINNSIKINSI